MQSGAVPHFCASSARSSGCADKQKTRREAVAKHGPKWEFNLPRSRRRTLLAAAAAHFDAILHPTKHLIFDEELDSRT